MSTERKLTAYICDECRDANKKRMTHPGQMHRVGICDCACRGERRGKPTEGKR